MPLNSRNATVALLFASFVAGCRDDSPPLTKAPVQNSPAKAPKREPKSLHVPAAKPTPDDSPVDSPSDENPSPPRDTVAATATGEFVTELTLPKVALSEAYDKICRIKVGQKLPALVLADPEGKPAPLEPLFGPKFTVIAFVRLEDPYAYELLDDMGRFIVPVFESKGVKSVAVAVARPSQAVANAIKKQNLRLPMLADVNGQALEQLSTDKNYPGPWIYLVDSDGKVLWFDAEYSRTTRRDLQVALQVLTRS
jgi:peroxiredoxin